MTSWVLTHRVRTNALRHPVHSTRSLVLPSQAAAPPRENRTDYFARARFRKGPGARRRNAKRGGASTVRRTVLQRMLVSCRLNL